MSDTPRTDGIISGWIFGNATARLVDMSRTLEREANEARRLLDAVYVVWMSDNTGDAFIDALDPVMHEVTQFCRGTSNPEREVRT
jgi:uncharacterized protein with ATP-grasp and redox domains